MPLSAINLDDTSIYLPLEEILVGEKASMFLAEEHDLQNNEFTKHANSSGFLQRSTH
jgi:hypothetical protein